MKRFRFILMAFICALSVGFVSCDGEDDGDEFGGDIVGTWMREYDDDYKWKEVVTFNSDGTVGMLLYQSTKYTSEYTPGETVEYNSTAETDISGTYTYSSATLYMDFGSEDVYGPITISVSGDSLTMIEVYNGKNYSSTYTCVE